VTWGGQEIGICRQTTQRKKQVFVVSILPIDLVEIGDFRPQILYYLKKNSGRPKSIFSTSQNFEGQLRPHPSPTTRCRTFRHYSLDPDIWAPSHDIAVAPKWRRSESCPAPCGVEGHVVTSVRLFACLSLCLSVGSLEKLWTDTTTTTNTITALLLLLLLQQQLLVVLLKMYWRAEQIFL